MDLNIWRPQLKNIIILSDYNIISNLAFIKIIERSIRVNIKLIYLEEISILSHNNNYSLWKDPNNDVYLNIPKKESFNLIMAVTDENIIHYCFYKVNTNEKLL